MGHVTCSNQGLLAITTLYIDSQELRTWISSKFRSINHFSFKRCVSSSGQYPPWLKRQERKNGSCQREHLNPTDCHLKRDRQYSQPINYYLKMRRSTTICRNRRASSLRLWFLHYWCSPCRCGRRWHWWSPPPKLDWWRGIQKWRYFTFHY